MLAAARCLSCCLLPTPPWRSHAGPHPLTTRTWLQPAWLGWYRPCKKRLRKQLGRWVLDRVSFRHRSSFSSAHACLLRQRNCDKLTILPETAKKPTQKPKVRFFDPQASANNQLVLWCMVRTKVELACVRIPGEPNLHVPAGCP